MRWIVLYFPLFLYSSVCYFTPPADWECCQPKNMSPHIQIGFVGKGSTEFRPSINLAVEEVDVSLKTYLKAVKQIHLAQGNAVWRDLGPFKVAAGEGRLIQLCSFSPCGEVEMFQAILIRDHQAYILTAAALKKDTPHLKETILKSLASLSIVPNLWTPLPLEEQRLQLQDFFSSIHTRPDDIALNDWNAMQWIQLQKIVEKEGSSMGSHWQFLVLKDGYAEIYSKKAQAKN
jgi:hypothetical protein